VSARLGTYLITVRDGDGHRVALFQGTVYRKNEPIDDLVT